MVIILPRYAVLFGLLAFILAFVPVLGTFITEWRETPPDLFQKGKEQVAETIEKRVAMLVNK